MAGAQFEVLTVRKPVCVGKPDRAQCVQTIVFAAKVSESHHHVFELRSRLVAMVSTLRLDLSVICQRQLRNFLGVLATVSKRGELFKIQ